MRPKAPNLWGLSDEYHPDLLLSILAAMRAERSEGRQMVGRGALTARIVIHQTDPA